MESHDLLDFVAAVLINFKINFLSNPALILAAGSYLILATKLT